MGRDVLLGGRADCELWGPPSNEPSGWLVQFGRFAPVLPWLSAGITLWTQLS